MSYEEFANKPSGTASTAVNATTQIDDPAQGVQDEFELRGGDGFLDGVVSGMACTISTTNIAVAAGRAYVGGKRYSGGTNVSFVGKSADDYYVYIDSADDDTPYKAKTTAPTSGELLLCTVTWNGTDTLSALNDNVKVLGIVDASIYVDVPGTLTTGVKAVRPVPRDLWIEGVEIICVANGTTSGAVTVDVHLGADGAKGDSIFTTQGNRPTVAHDTADYTIGVSGEPDGDRKPDAGEHLVVEIDAVDGGAVADTLGVLIKARLR